MLVVVGTRPEAIKMAPVVAAFRARSAEADVRVALTGQHTTMVDQALSAFRMEADYNLGIMKEGQTLYDVAHGCLDGLRDVVRALKPDAILVQGDTATVCFGSMVGYFERVKVGHVEAGLRSHDKWAPFPEEIFRHVSDIVSDWHFAPTRGAAKNLRREGTRRQTIHVTGNTVVDALLEVAAAPGKPANPVVRAALAGRARLVLVTAHRRESFGAPLQEVFGAIRQLADEREDIVVVYPVHPNPNVHRPAHDLLAGHPRIRLTEPLGYSDLVRALEHATLVLSDSGGIQEEAPTFGTPVLVLREVTERPEGIRAGVAKLVGTSERKILRWSRRVLDGKWSQPDVNPYGDGKAGARIADILISDLTGGRRKTKDLA